MKTMGDADQDNIDSPQLYSCPECGTEVHPPQEPGQNVLVCPACGNQFFVQLHEEADDEPAEAIDTRADEIDANKIRQIATLRRGLYRTRSYFIVGLIAAVVASIQLGINLVLSIRRDGFTLVAVGYIAAIVAAAMIYWRLWARLADNSHELAATRMVDPDATPDFSDLSDGSQRVQALEQMNTPPKNDDQQTG